MKREIRDEIVEMIRCGIVKENFYQIVKKMGIFIDESYLNNTTLYSEKLPIYALNPYSEKQKMLHLLWDLLELSPYKLDVSFSILIRRAIAKELFKKCGKNFIALNGVKFNLGHQIEVGDDVFLNEDCYIDSKGGVFLGDSVALTERVMIFSHTHSENCHSERVYKPVRIESFAKIYTNCIINYGVTIGKGAIVGANSIVTKDVNAYEVVAGSPAKYIRDRETNDKRDKELSHFWLNGKAFQEEK
ncbi:MAG: acyltransferase [Fusobacteria bacterium]|nr:acyltransferase [Fusobacteriota bacterium]